MSRPQRAADLGIVIGRFAPGTLDAISDVAGVRVAATTIVRGDVGSVRAAVEAGRWPKATCWVSEGNSSRT